METTTQENKDFSTEVICIIPRSENEVYRISKIAYKGTSFRDVRIFFKPKQEDRLAPTKKGLWIEEALLEEVVNGLVIAKNWPKVERPEGAKFHSVTVWEIPLSEKEIYRISKGCGEKNGFVDLRRFFKKDGQFVPYKRKGVTITEACLDQVIEGLQLTEPRQLDSNS